MEGPAVHKVWNELKASHATLNKYTSKYKDAGCDLSAVMAKLDEAAALIRVGRITMSEAMIAEDHTNTDNIKKQVKLMHQIGAQASDMQPALFLVVQKAVQKK